MCHCLSTEPHFGELGLTIFMQLGWWSSKEYDFQYLIPLYRLHWSALQILILAAVFPKVWKLKGWQ
jgi:hypothetical protein